MLAEPGAGHNRISRELEIINAKPCSDLECCRAAALPALVALSSFCRAQQAPLPNKPGKGNKVFCFLWTVPREKTRMCKLPSCLKVRKREKLLS